MLTGKKLHCGDAPQLQICKEYWIGPKFSTLGIREKNLLVKNMGGKRDHSGSIMILNAKTDGPVLPVRKCEAWSWCLESLCWADSRRYWRTKEKQQLHCIPVSVTMQGFSDFYSFRKLPGDLLSLSWDINLISWLLKSLIWASLYPSPIFFKITSAVFTRNELPSSGSLL